MTEQMAIECLEYLLNECVYMEHYVHGREFSETANVIRKALEEIQQYRAIGTVEELQALKEKSEAKEPKGNDGCTCPNCNTFNEVFMKRKNTVGKDIVNCWHCGQAVLLDWE